MFSVKIIYATKGSIKIRSKDDENGISWINVNGCRLVVEQDNRFSDLNALYYTVAVKCSVNLTMLSKNWIKHVFSMRANIFEHAFL